MSTQADREASLRLLLPHPSQWTVNEAEEARACSGYCTVRYEAGARIVDVPRLCPAHGGRVDA